MPIIKTNGHNIDYLDVGTGPVILLIHGAASNNRQWRQLIENYSGQYRFLAINLFGYGETTPWSDDVTQTMADQVGLVEALCADVDPPISIIGHSFGGSVAALSAKALGDKVPGLVLLEANPFPLLANANQTEAYNEVINLWEFLHHHATSGEWRKVAERFVNYWLGEGAWLSLPVDRQEAFISTLPNNVYEWDAIMSMDVSADVWQGIKASTLYVRARQTTKSITGIYQVLQDLCPHWEYVEVAEGGHMAPVTKPDLVNPLVMDFLGKAI